MQCRILEIDLAPRGIPDDVDARIGPLLDKLRANHPAVSLKAGELADADHPTSHSSYFIGLWFSGVPSAVASVATMCEEITQYCNMNRMPIIEVRPEHVEYQRILDEFKFAVSRG